MMELIKSRLLFSVWFSCLASMKVRVVELLDLLDLLGFVDDVALALPVRVPVRVRVCVIMYWFWKAMTGPIVLARSRVATVKYFILYKELL